MRIADNSMGTGIAIETEEGDSPELNVIARRLLPEWLELFARKNADYGAGSAFGLGLQGQYSDIHRKMIKLKRAMWDGHDMAFEGLEEIISDLIGHLFLTKYMLVLKEEGDREVAYSGSTDSFVERFISELGGPEQALRLSGALSEGLSAKVIARCRELADEGFYEAEAGAPVDQDDAEHSAREAVQRYRRDVATQAVTSGISANEYEAMKQEAMAKRLERRELERLHDIGEAIRTHKSAPRDGFADEAFADSDARQHGVVIGYNFEAESKVGPSRIVTEQENGVTRYYHEAYPGSDREPLVLVPSALVGRLEKDHYVLSQDTKGGLRELAEWAERTSR